MKTIFTILFTLVFVTGIYTQKGYTQVPITYYDFENDNNRNTIGENSVQYNVNTVDPTYYDGDVYRLSGTSLYYPSYTYGAGVANGNTGSNFGAAIYGNNWQNASTDPGSNFTDAYYFHVNTLGFDSIKINYNFFVNEKGPWGMGIYADNGTTALLGNADISSSYNNWYSITWTLPTGPTINYDHVVFCIYFYKGSNNSFSNNTGYALVDNIQVYSNLTTEGAGNKTLLNNPNIYTCKTSGLTGSAYVRHHFTATGTGTNITLGGYEPFQYFLNISNNAVLDCGLSTNAIGDYGSTSAFNLSSGSTLIISSPNGIAQAGTASGNIQTANRNFNSDANYVYQQTLGSLNNEKKKINIGIPIIKTGKKGHINFGSRKNLIGLYRAIPEYNAVESKLIISEQIQNDAPSAQVTGTGLPTTLNNLTINNTLGVILNKNITVGGILTLSSGLLKTTSNYTLFFGNLAISPSEDCGAYIEGTAVMNQRTVGMGNLDFLNCFIHTGANIGNVTITRVTGADGIISSNGNSGIAANWDIVTTIPLGNGITKDVTYRWPCDLDNEHPFAPSILAQLYYVNGTNLEPVGAGVDVSGSDPRNITVAHSHFSKYTIGSSDAPLPVRLSSFTSSPRGRNVLLDWVTASEINNAGFNIERIQSSELGIQNWEKIGYLNGKGTVNTPTKYTFEDKNLQTGKYMYRLKQIDNNGNFEYFTLNGEVEVGVPKKFSLSQNYPNPFNPTTKIDFDLPIDSKVNIVLYDMNGREVRTLVNEARTAGYHTVQFNANDLSSGIYFYRISADKFVMAKKMMLIK